ncbi:MAG: hypothetical protein H7833_02200 [Magnetococcus sp. DMHC-1]
MNPFVSLLLVLVAHLFSPRHNARIRLLKAQIRILRSRVPGKTIKPSPAEKSELLRLGAVCGHDIDNLMEIVRPSTYRRWLCQTNKGQPFKRIGRPHLTKELRDTAVRMAKENLLWRYRRIVGEIKKLGLYAGANTVKRILTEAGIHPTPKKEKKKPPLPWLTFIKAHMESIVATDFFSKDIFTPLGKRTAYVLVFIHLGSRRVTSVRRPTTRTAPGSLSRPETPSCGARTRRSSHGS